MAMLAGNYPSMSWTTHRWRCCAWSGPTRPHPTMFCDGPDGVGGTKNGLVELITEPEDT